VSFKETLRIYSEKIKVIWKKGKVQRAFRMTYDITWYIILFIFILAFIGFFFVGGIGAGYFASLVKDEPVRSYENMKRNIYNYEETSKVYFADEKYFGDIRSDLHREEVSLDEVSDILINAVIATEDQEFNQHKGVVPKAIVRAVLQEATNAKMKTGGSTLTQQLIKNQILTDEVSFDRKAKEILLALRLENFFTKDQILEAYFNIIPYGREASGQNIAGIQTAAQGIFGVDASDVNLAQAAYLAGLPQSPSYYTPFTNKGKLKEVADLQPGLNRMKTVLNRMYDAAYITKEEYDGALDYDLESDFIKKPKSNTERSYLVDEVEKRAKKILITKLAKEDGYTEEDLASDETLNKEYSVLADRDLRRNGYTIHTTIDKDIYNKAQEIVKNFQEYGPDTYEIDEETGEEIPKPVQTGGILIENHTGKIISFTGGRGYSEDSQLNHATSAPRSNGSTIKPLLDYAPAMEKGAIQPGTPIADIPGSIPFPGLAEPWSPDNYGGTFHGMVSARQALVQSYNVPTARVYSKIYDDNPAKEYLGKMGFTTLSDADYTNPSLSIGGMSRGVTVEENANAFATFGNNGKFVDAYMIDKIETSDGETIYQHESKEVDVFSPQTNYLTLDIMRDVISEGTGTYLNSQLKDSSVDWAGKTGTSQEWKDTWFVATNPNVTFATWMGYDTPKSLQCADCSLGYSDRNVKLWAELINSASDIKPDLIAPSEKFKRPDGIVEKSYCAISGKLPSELCKQAGLVETDLFNEKHVPPETDDSLMKGTQVTVNGKSVKAGPGTPKEFTNGSGLTFNPEFLKKHGYDKLSDISVLLPQKNREKWEKIGIPSGDIGDGDAIKDDGKKPSAPKSAKKSNDKLTWDKSASNDVIGYRIYRASSSDGDFKLVGNTTSTSYKISNDKAVYYIKAVDYFGLESSASDKISVGG